MINTLFKASALRIPKTKNCRVPLSAPLKDFLEGFSKVYLFFFRVQGLGVLDLGFRGSGGV